MKENIIDSHSALLVVDAQESFKARGNTFWQSGGPVDFSDNITFLVNGFRNANQPVYFILHTDDDPGFSLDSPYFRVMDILNYRPDEPIVIKQAHNAFTGTNLLPMLIQSGINRVVICGIRTEQCCETTTRVASDIGFNVVFVTNATMTFPLAHPYTGEKMSIEQIQVRTEMVLHNRFAKIATVEDVLSELRGE